MVSAPLVPAVNAIADVDKCEFDVTLTSPFIKDTVAFLPLLFSNYLLTSNFTFFYKIFD